MELGQEQPATYLANGYLKDSKTNRFAKGNKGGTGNPYMKRVMELRATLYKSLGGDDVHDIIKAMVELAKKGDVAAARLILGYACPAPASIDTTGLLPSNTTIVATIPRNQAMQLMAEHSTSN